MSVLRPFRAIRPKKENASKVAALPYDVMNSQEAKEMVKKAAKLSEHVRYVGWDVGMSVNGPVLIEGNQFPGHPGHVPRSSRIR